MLFNHAMEGYDGWQSFLVINMEQLTFELSFAESVSLLALFVQIVLVFFAYKAIRKNEIMAKKRAVVDLILKQREDPTLKRAFKVMYECREKKGNLSDLFNKAGEESQRIRDDVLYALDQLEFIAVGIRLNAFDEDVYKDLQCSKIIKTWDSAAGFVMNLRQEKQTKTLYQDLERLAARWSANPIKELKKQDYLDK